MSLRVGSYYSGNEMEPEASVEGSPVSEYSLNYLPTNFAMLKARQAQNLS